MNTPDEMIACIQAHKDGKQLQYYYGEKWYDVFGSPNFNFAAHPYRIKLEPTLRPWKPEEVPVGAIFRNKTTRNIYLCVGAMVAGSQPVLLEHGNSYSLISVLKCYEHSIDQGKTWHPCGVME